MSRKLRLPDKITFGLLLLLAGCVSENSKGLEIVEVSPRSITIRAQSVLPLFGGPSAVSVEKVTAVAHKHCQRYLKIARRIMQETRKTDRVVTFECEGEDR